MLCYQFTNVLLILLVRKICTHAYLAAFFTESLDPQDKPTVTHISDHYFHMSSLPPSVSTFQNLAK